MLFVKRSAICKILNVSKKIPRVLTIAGSDSGGGAGIQADLKTFTVLGVYGLCVITSVTAQNTVEVSAVHDLPERLVESQIDAVMSDIGCDAAKLGMLSNERIIKAVAGGIEKYGIERLVVDPVMRSKAGNVLLRNSCTELLKEIIIPKALLITPNIPEAEVLSSVTIKNIRDMRTAAERIHSLGAKTVLVKGGHLRKDLPATDIFFDGKEFRELSCKRIETKNTHGTGCTFSAAVCAFLAKGTPLAVSAERAKSFITEAVRNSLDLGKGHGPLGLFSLTRNSKF